uniref:Sperm microtubule inner protein 1 C-terminal domain-containing protein n=1 Tax=Equus caballus TaxID=9796 RepID=A0A5F5PWZ9_HORSE
MESPQYGKNDRRLQTDQGAWINKNQACWQEHIQKEAAARVAWKINYGHKYPKEGPIPRKRLQQAPLRSALGVGPMPVTSSQDSKEVQAGWPETKGVWDQLSRGVGVQDPPPKGDISEARGVTWGPAGQTKLEGLKMRQVPPSTLQLLFQGISHDGQGRALYLQERHRQKPEEKYPYPILSSWEYGWHVGGAMEDTRAPTYARSQPITKTFYIKNTVFHIPRRTDQLM